MAQVLKGEKRVYACIADCGRIGRNIEVDDRLRTNKRTRVLHAQGIGKADTTFKQDGKLVKQETKTNCGTVTATYQDNIFAGIDLNDKATLSPYILPKCDIVAYGYDVQADYDTEQDLYIFTREEFIDFLFGYGKPLLKVNHKDDGYCLNINTYKTSKVKFEYFEESCLNQMNKGEYLESIGR